MVGINLISEKLKSISNAKKQERSRTERSEVRDWLDGSSYCNFKQEVSVSARFVDCLKAGKKIQEDVLC